MDAAMVTMRLVDEVWNGGRTELLDELFAPEFVHDGHTDVPASLAEWQRRQAGFWSGTRYEVLRLVADGTDAALHWRATAVHSGEWAGIPATGRTVSWRGAHFLTVHDGRITALHATAGLHEVHAQLTAAG